MPAVLRASIWMPMTGRSPASTSLAAKAFGKDVKEVWLNDSSKQYMESVAETLGLSPEYLKQTNWKGPLQRHARDPCDGR